MDLTLFDELKAAFSNLLWHDTQQQFAPQKGIDGAGVTTDMPLAVISEVVGADTYLCEAQPGTTSSDAAWRCQKISVAGAVTTITWADSGRFSQVASNRASLVYS